jgi:hypothetical protein
VYVDNHLTDRGLDPFDTVERRERTRGTFVNVAVFAPPGATEL